MSEKEILQRFGLRATKQRLAILQRFCEAGSKHLCVEDVCGEASGRNAAVPIATVYRVLRELERVGIVRRCSPAMGTTVRFELCQLAHHDHLICKNCGGIVEFCDELLLERYKRIAQMNGFTPTSFSLSITGYCSACVGTITDTALKQSHRLVTVPRRRKRNEYSSAAFLSGK